MTEAPTGAPAAAEGQAAKRCMSDALRKRPMSTQKKKSVPKGFSAAPRCRKALFSAHTM